MNQQTYFRLVKRVEELETTVDELREAIEAMKPRRGRPPKTLTVNDLDVPSGFTQ